ncbi:MAG: hypothetical protein R2725_06015 [Solirubrobacterales bacterium]
MTPDPPITLEAIGLESWQQLYELDPEEVMARIDKAPLHAGDAFLAVIQLRAMADTARSVKALDAGTKTLERATWILVVLGMVSLLIAVAALVVAITNG